MDALSFDMAVVMAAELDGIDGANDAIRESEKSAEVATVNLLARIFKDG